MLHQILALQSEVDSKRYVLNAISVRSAFKFLRLSCKADVPVFWLDGFATNEISGALLRAFALRCWRPVVSSSL